MSRHDYNDAMALLNDRDREAVRTELNKMTGPASKLPHQGFERPSHCAFGPDGALYVSTSNAQNLSQEGMTPAPENQRDAIIRVAPSR